MPPDQLGAAVIRVLQAITHTMCRLGSLRAEPCMQRSESCVEPVSKWLVIGSEARSLCAEVIRMPGSDRL